MIKKTIRIVYNDLLAMFSINKLLATIGVYIIINYITLNLYDTKSINDVIKFSFYGVNNIIDMPIELLKWTLCQMLLIYFVLSFINDEFKRRRVIVVVKVGSRRAWINSLVVSTFIACAVYYIIGFLLLILFNFGYISSHINFAELMEVFILLVLSSFTICLIGFALCLFISSEAAIFTVVLFMYYFSIAIGSINISFDKYLIFNQGILAKHEFLAYSFQWSYNYDAIIILLIYLFIKKIVAKIDL